MATEQEPVCYGCGTRPEVHGSPWCSRCHDAISERERQAFLTRIKSCSSCAAPIVWFQTAAGKLMPVDHRSVRVGDTQLDLPRHISHFATCPNANKHRRRR